MGQDVGNPGSRAESRGHLCTAMSSRLSSTASSGSNSQMKKAKFLQNLFVATLFVTAIVHVYNFCWPSPGLGPGRLLFASFITAKIILPHEDPTQYAVKSPFTLEPTIHLQHSTMTSPTLCSAIVLHPERCPISEWTWAIRHGLLAINQNGSFYISTRDRPSRSAL